MPSEVTADTASIENIPTPSPSESTIVRNPSTDPTLLASNRLESLSRPKLYIGATEQEWKSRYNFHKSTIKLEHMESSTSLSHHIWTLKKNGVPYNIQWKIAAAVPAYSKESRRCPLCLAEKTNILFGDKQLLLNKRAEIMNKCKHKVKHKLSALK